MVRPRVLVIGGLDPSGGAGITADAHAVAACGGFPLAVASCLTVQNRHGFRRVEPVAPNLLAAMLDAAADDGQLRAIKIGMVATPAVAVALGRWLAARRAEGVPVVVDPVLSATAGGYAVAAALVAALREHL